MLVAQSEAAETNNASGAVLCAGNALIRRIKDMISPMVRAPLTAIPKPALNRDLPV